MALVTVSYRAVHDRPRIDATAANGVFFELRKQYEQLSRQIALRPHEAMLYLRRGRVCAKLVLLENPGDRVLACAGALEDYRAAYERGGGHWNFPFGELNPLNPASLTPTTAPAFPGAPPDRIVQAQALADAARATLWIYRVDLAKLLLARAAEVNADEPLVRIEQLRFSGFDDRPWSEVSTELQALGADAALSESPEYWSALAFAHRQNRDFAKSRQALSRARALDPLDPAVQQALAMLEHISDADKPGGDVAARSLQTDPWEIFISLRTARALLQSERPADAKAVISQVLQVAPAFPDALFELAVCHHELREFQKAIEVYDKLLKLTPFNASAHTNKGLAYQELGQFRPALAAQEAALLIDPKNKRYRLRCANVLRELEKLPAAEKMYRAALEIDPSLVEASNGLGGVLFDQQRIADARAVFEAVLERQPNEVVALLAMGALAEQDRQYDAAIAYMRRAVGAAPASDRALGGLASVLLHADRWDELCAEVQATLDRAPQRVVAYQWRALCHAHAGRFDDALADYDHCIRLAPTDANAHAFRGAMRLLLNQPAPAALADFDQALRIQPNFVFAAEMAWVAGRDTGRNDPEAPVKRALEESPAANTWGRNLLRFVLGRLEAEELCDQAKTKQQQCEAFYIIGEKSRLIDGIDAGRPWFERCKELSTPDFETFLARWRLRSDADAPGGR
ncbi:lipoprotein NlpI [Phycisphaerae bacterium RAS1]|nr:lipoprotein NlpI [Phycisphaerae bacterium RAS1]